MSARNPAKAIPNTSTKSCAGEVRRDWASAALDAVVGAVVGVATGCAVGLGGGVEVGAGPVGSTSCPTGVEIRAALTNPQSKSSLASTLVGPWLAIIVIRMRRPLRSAAPMNVRCALVV